MSLTLYMIKTNYYFNLESMLKYHHIKKSILLQVQENNKLKKTTYKISYTVSYAKYLITFYVVDC